MNFNFIIIKYLTCQKLVFLRSRIFESKLNCHLIVDMLCLKIFTKLKFVQILLVKRIIDWNKKIIFSFSSATTNLPLDLCSLRFSTVALRTSCAKESSFILSLSELSYIIRQDGSRNIRKKIIYKSSTKPSFVT